MFCYKSERAFNCSVIKDGPSYPACPHRTSDASVYVMKEFVNKSWIFCTPVPVYPLEDLCTALQAGRSWAQFRVKHSRFFIDLNLSSRT